MIEIAFNGTETEIHKFKYKNSFIEHYTDK